MSVPSSVTRVFSVRRTVVAFAIPKSMILATAAPSLTETRTFEGLRSRWMIAF
jgi:hypothetical protein